MRATSIPTPPRLRFLHVIELVSAPWMSFYQPIIINSLMHFKFTRHELFFGIVERGRVGGLCMHVSSSSPFMLSALSSPSFASIFFSHAPKMYDTHKSKLSTRNLYKKGKKTFDIKIMLAATRVGFFPCSGSLKIHVEMALSSLNAEILPFLLLAL